MHTCSASCGVPIEMCFSLFKHHCGLLERGYMWVTQLVGLNVQTWWRTENRCAVVARQSSPHSQKHNAWSELPGWPWPARRLTWCSVIVKEFRVSPEGFSLVSGLPNTDHQPAPWASSDQFCISTVTDDSEEWACEDETLSLSNESQ